MMKNLGFLLSAFLVLGGKAWADAPQPWQLSFQPAATSLAEDLHRLNSGVNIMIFAVAAFVMVLLLICIVRFNQRANPVPSKTSHNTLLEIVWTVVPVLMLVGVAIPSLILLYKQLEIPATDLTVKAVGHQWYWSYEYPDAGISFDSNMIADKDLKPGQLRLLEVDNALVLPVGMNIKIQITATDVIHSWTVPSFGVKHDGVPGRVNESWFKIDREGVFYGQCSELCGVGHAYMPIKVVAVSQEKYKEWLIEAKKKFAALGVLDAKQFAALGR